LFGEAPGWFYGLPHDEQTRLLGWYRVHRDPEGPERRRARKLKEQLKGNPAMSALMRKRRR
jgi:hypothetical protein